MSSKSLIFISNDVGYDIDDALRYTGLSSQDAFRRITGGRPSIFDIQKLRRDIVKRTKDITDEDYILICGSTNITALVIATIICEYTHLTVLNFLLMDSRNRSYSLEVFPLKQSKYTNMKIQDILREREDATGN